MTDKEVFKHLAELGDFEKLTSAEQCLICDYLHYNLDRIAEFANRESDYNYCWGGCSSEGYCDNANNPWGFDTTFKSIDSWNIGYANIFDEVKATIIQTKKKFGVLVKEEVWLDGDYFTFKFWDCSKEEICFNKLPFWSCEVSSIHNRTENLLAKAEKLKAEIKKLQEELYEIEDELNQREVETFAEAV